MTVQSLEWKAGWFGGKVCVGLTETSINHSTRKSRTEIEFEEIREVYYHVQRLFLVLESWSLTVISKSGNKIAINGTDGLAPNRKRARRKLLATFFRFYDQASPGAEVVLGFRPTRFGAAIWAASTLFALCWTLFLLWRDGMMESPIEWLTFAGVAIFISAAMAWGFIRQSGSKKRRALHLYEELSS